MTDRLKKKSFDSLIQYFPDEIAWLLRNLPDNIKSSANEIRIRCGKPLMIMTNQTCFFPDKCKILSQKTITDIFEKLCDYSVYSHQAELSQGFITLPGGHRAGICGTASFDKNGCRTIKYISSVNIRIAAEYIGCADKIMQKIFSDKLCGVLIAGPPCCGKTTILRDIALSLSSEGRMKKVVIVDERGEIAAMYRGEAQNTLGISCDVLNCYPKGEGIMIALRTLAPDVIICDEIGGKEDAAAVCEGINAGVAIISSVHACNAKELYNRKAINSLLETGAFEKIVFLKGGEHRGEISEIVEVTDSAC